MAISKDDFRNLDKFNSNALKNAFQDAQTSEIMLRYARFKENDEFLLGKFVNETKERISSGLTSGMVVILDKQLLSILNEKGAVPSNSGSSAFTSIKFSKDPTKLFAYLPTSRDDYLISPYRLEILNEIGHVSLPNQSLGIIEYKGTIYRVKKDSQTYQITLNPLRNNVSQLLADLKKDNLIYPAKVDYNIIQYVRKLENVYELTHHIYSYHLTPEGHALIKQSEIEKAIFCPPEILPLKKDITKMLRSNKSKASRLLILSPDELNKIDYFIEKGYLSVDASKNPAFLLLKITDVGNSVWNEASKVSSFLPLRIPEHAERGNWKDYYKFTPMLPSAVHIGSAIGVMAYENNDSKYDEHYGNIRYVLGPKGIGKTFAIMQAIAALGLDVEYHTFKNGKEEITNILNSDGKSVDKKIEDFKSARSSHFFDLEIRGDYEKLSSNKIHVYDDFHYVCEDVINGKKSKDEAIAYLNKVIESKNSLSLVVSNEPLNYYTQIGEKFLKGVESLKGNTYENYIEVGDINWKIYNNVVQFYIDRFNASVDWEAVYLLYNRTSNYRTLVSAINASDGHLTIEGLDKIGFRIPKKEHLLELLNSDMTSDHDYFQALFSNQGARNLDKNAKLAGGLTLKDALRPDNEKIAEIASKLNVKNKVERRLMLTR